MDALKLFTKGNNMSQMKLARYQPIGFVDGEGVRNSLYFAGCLFNCKGCYNKSIQDFTNGDSLTSEFKERLWKDTDNEFIDGISILGGEPLMNVQSVASIVREFRQRYGDSKTIWMWSGFTIEEIAEIAQVPTDYYKDLVDVISGIDVLVDGQFKKDLYQPNLAFRGSLNQRIIDVKQTNQTSKLTLWNDGNY